MRLRILYSPESPRVNAGPCRGTSTTGLGVASARSGSGGAGFRAASEDNPASKRVSSRVDTGRSPGSLVMHTASTPSE